MSSMLKIRDFERPTKHHAIVNERGNSDGQIGDVARDG